MNSKFLIRLFLFSGDWNDALMLEHINLIEALPPSPVWLGAGCKPSPGTAGSEAISACVAMVKQSDVSTTQQAGKML